MARTPQELRDYADEHLFYEIWMASEMTKRLRRHAALFDGGLSVERDGPLAAELLDFPGRNADIESFATHSRVLVQFLYPHKPKPSNIIAADFFDRKSDWSSGIRPKRPDSLLKVNERVPVEIAHLGFGRVRRKDKRWPYEAIWGDLAKVLEVFLDSAPVDRLSTKFRKEAKALLPGASPASPQELITDLDRLTRAARVGMTTTATPTWSPPFDPYPDSYGGGTVVLPPKREPEYGD